MHLQLEHTFAETLEGLYVAWEPEGFPQPELLQLNTALFESLGLPEMSESEAAALFQGRRSPKTPTPLPRPMQAISLVVFLRS